MRLITSRQILILLAAGLLVTMALNLFLSKRLSDDVSGEIRNRELELLFGAIEAGPLAIARLQSGAISQQQLNQLMANPQLQDRGIIATEILGGDGLGFEFAKWQTKEAFRGDCIQTHEKTYQFSDAIHPFKVGIQLDRCHVLSEERRILKSASLTIVIITLLTLALIGLCTLPAAASIRAAEMAFHTRFQTIGNIIFKPVRDLVREAVRSVELEREQSLTTIAQQVSHDIRSPLSALNLAVSALPDSNSDQAQVIRAASKRISAIAEQLIGARKAARHSESIELQKVVREMAAEKKLEFSGHPELKINLDDGLCEPIQVRINRDQFARALSNLINNAAQALNFSGDITVGLRLFPRTVEVSVKDNGPGIPTEILGQLDLKPVSFGNKGTALGLPHARSTVENCGGKFTIETKVGAGTTVRIIFPRLEGAKSDATSGAV